mmetsp:Transcript_549/g.1418  ORF Transcript_549/g.1418 Transcript_549/m.1418 type:complete len:369 (-) Transcript_549:1643-2749(-)
MSGFSSNSDLKDRKLCDRLSMLSSWYSSSLGSAMALRLMSYVYSVMGLLLPLTMMTSMARQSLRTPGESSIAKSSLISRLQPNCFVAASRREAMLTFGDKYDASILYSEPIAPSMAQPTCRPKPMDTWKSLPMRARMSSRSQNCLSRGERLSATWMTTKAASARSARCATLSRFSSGRLAAASSRLSGLEASCVGSFQTSRKASPMFLLAEPPCSETSMCTILAMLLTNSMTPSCSTSVASVKRRMSQKPKMAHILWPGTMGLRSPPLRMFSATTSAPASPKPTASREQILVIEFSRMRVSSCCSSLVATARICILASGFSLISFTFCTMRSSGCSTSALASRLKSSAPRPSTMQVKVVRHVLRMASN